MKLHKLHRKIKFATSVEIATEVIMDTVNYHKFIPSIERCQPIQKRGDFNEVSFHARLIIPFQYTMITEKNSSHSIYFKQTSGFFSHLEGEWSFFEDSFNGNSVGECVLDVGLSGIIPDSVVSVTTELFFPRMMYEFQKESAKRLQQRQGIYQDGF